jgi:hypothetical protein
MASPSESKDDSDSTSSVIGEMVTGSITSGGKVEGEVNSLGV